MTPEPVGWCTVVECPMPTAIVRVAKLVADLQAIVDKHERLIAGSR